MHRARDVRAPSEIDRVAESGQSGRGGETRTLFEG
jgi:hypothetical protein